MVITVYDLVDVPLSMLWLSCVKMCMNYVGIQYAIYGLSNKSVAVHRLMSILYYDHEIQMCTSAQKLIVLEKPIDLNVFFISGTTEKNKFLCWIFEGS